MIKYECCSDYMFLWLPKKINGKWRWLKTVKIEYTICKQIIGGCVLEHMVNEKMYVKGEDYD